MDNAPEGTKRPSRTEALKRIAELLKTGKVIPTKHWQDRARQRRFDDQDLRAVRRSGQILEEGEWSADYGNYKFRIVGRDADGHSFKVVVAYNAAGELFLISGMRRERGAWQAE